jgi:hypothetical protein
MPVGGGLIIGATHMKQKRGTTKKGQPKPSGLNNPQSPNFVGRHSPKARPGKWFCPTCNRERPQSEFQNRRPDKVLGEIIPLVHVSVVETK